MNVTENNNQVSSSLNLNFTDEKERLKTFDTWPKNAPVTAAKLARAGFYYTKNGLFVKCFSCQLEYSDWQFSDSVMGKHKGLSPDCEFVNNAFRSSTVERLQNEDTENQDENNTSLENRCSLATSSRHENSSGLHMDIPQELVNGNVDTNINVRMRLESERLKSFSKWPLNFIRPVELSRAGFYYLQEGDKVKCAFCDGVIYKWKPGDVPLREHVRLFPNCPYILAPDLISRDECGPYNWHDGMSCSESKPVGPKTDTLAKLGITAHESPKHPSMVSSDARLKTFAKWPPTSPLKPEELVTAGFFFLNMRDYTKCFHCDGGLCNWEVGDDPWVEHARWFPKCKYVYLIKGSSFIEESLRKHENMLQTVTTAGSSSSKSDVDPRFATEIETIMSTNEVKFYMNQGIPFNTLKQAIGNYIVQNGKGFSSREELIDTLNSMFSLNKVNCSNSTSNAASQDETGTSNKLALNVASLMNGHEEGHPVNCEAVDPTLLKEENVRLKEQRLCKICLDEEVGIVFLPCGHLVSCSSCAASLKDCPMCRQPIRGIVRTYLS